MNLELLREIRKDKGMTQQDMADAIGYTSKSAYCQMETGTSRISAETANKIAKALTMTDEQKLAVFFPDCS